MRREAERRKRFAVEMSRRGFMKTAIYGGLGATAWSAGLHPSYVWAQQGRSYPKWIPANTSPPKRDGVFTFASQWDAPALDPRLTLSAGLFVIASAVYSRLVRLPYAVEAKDHRDMSVKPDLAESWEVSPDAKVYTFHLRQGVRWQNVPPLNGREFTAADVKSCFEAYQKEGVQAFTFSVIDGIETPDKYTARFILREPFTQVLDTLAAPIAVVFPREVLEEDGDLKKRMIGTGPFILKEHTRKVRVVLARNPDYFIKGQPYLDEYRILSAPDQATRVAAFRTGQNDCLFRINSFSDLDPILRTNPNTIVQDMDTSKTPFGLAVRHDDPKSPFHDIRVRRALSMAIDRQRQIDTLFEGQGIGGWGIPYFFYREEPPSLKELGPWYQYNPAEAKRLMAAAGYPNGFETSIFYYEYYPTMTSQVQLVQQDLKKNLNIDMKISKLDYTTYHGRYTEGKWDAMVWGFQQGHATSVDEHIYEYMHSKASKNFFKVSDPVIDELAVKIRREADEVERKKLIRQVFERDHDLVFRIWMPYWAGLFLWQPQIQNLRCIGLVQGVPYGAAMQAAVWHEG